MKRHELKAIVKECLVEILRDNMDVFQEAAPAPRGRATKKAQRTKRSPQKQVLKNSLMSLVQEQIQRPPPRHAQPQPRQPIQPGGPLTTEQLILSAASTMNQQNEMGERSSRTMEYEMPRGGQPVDEGYEPYGAYEGDGGGGGGVVPPAPQVDAGVDGDSRWAKLAFFDQ